MDTALTTGMFTTNLLSVNPVKKDVLKTTKDGFNNIFKKSLDNKQVEKEGPSKKTDNKNKLGNEKKNDDVKSKDAKKEEDDELEVKKIRDRIKSKLKDVSKPLESLEGALDEAQNRLDELLEKLDVDAEDLLENMDLGEKFDSVGPQNVETEKITLNTKDDNEKIDITLVDQDAETDFDFGDQNLTDDMSKNKDNLKESKFKVRDFRNNRLDNITDNREVVTEKFNVSAITAGVSLKNGINNSVSGMQEKIDVIKQVTEQMDVSLFDGKTESVMKLKPDDLGKVTVKISLENGIINAKFLAESEKVKEILESGFNQLKDALEKQGMMIQEFSVSVDNGNSGERELFESRRKFFNNKRNDKIDNVYDYGNLDYYNYQDDNLNSLWPDSTISFSA